jgi:two-component system chemotaxis response regulator CheB
MRVFIIDDSVFFRRVISKVLDTPDIVIVGEASDPYEARDKMIEADPDVITLDINMPNMNGLEFMRILLPQWKLPVIIVSTMDRMEQEARSSGAYDFCPKPADTQGESFETFSQRLRLCVYSACGRPISVAAPPIPANTSISYRGLVAIGASTGGTQSTTTILKNLPANFPGTIIVQHMPPAFTKMYAESLNRDCAMKVKEAEDGDEIKQGTALIGRGDRHIEVVKRGDKYFAALKQGAKVSGHIPSVDVMFKSVAEVCGTNAIGVILTGMGADGARGLLEMKRKGAFTIGQDEASCVVYGMPKEAFDMGAVSKQCHINQIAQLLMSRVTVR